MEKYVATLEGLIFTLEYIGKICKNYLLQVNFAK